MLNVPAPAFPAPASQQRAGEGGRKKIPLKPGRSLIDWIRLTKSGKDLTGLQGRLIEVTEEELARHNKKEDCWICIRGLVFNVTPYMEYHPGGEDELMKAAGADGTHLFDQVHRWVNYESMLKECLIGRMAVKPVAKDTSAGTKKEKDILNGVLPKMLSQSFPKDLCPRYDWFQNDLTITVAIYSKQKKDTMSELVTVDYEDGILRTEVIIEEYSYLLHLELSYAVKEEIAVHISGTVGKVEIVMKKRENIFWKKLGQPLDKHNSFIKRTERELFYRKCRLVSKTHVTYNTKLFCLMLPHSTRIIVPTGQHVYLKHTVAGTEIVKPYTPVSPALQLDSKELVRNDSKYIYLMIKIYPNGVFTQDIDKLQIGDNLLVSSPQGNFRKSLLHTIEDLFLVAAGTGFTPMVNLLANICSFRKIKLMFFNRTEDDILWKEQLEQLAVTNERFDVQFILSEPTDDWTGKRGKISLHLLSEFLKRSHEESKTLICICGPTAFTEQGIRILKDIGYSEEEIYAFTE